MKLNRILNDLLFVATLCLFSRASYACDVPGAVGADIGTSAGLTDIGAAQIPAPETRRQQHTSDCVSTMSLWSDLDHASLVASQQGVGAGAQEGVAADFVQRPFTANQALFEAVLRGDQDLIERALEGGVDVNLQNDCDYTALILAIQFGEMTSIRIIDRLLETPDIDVNFQNIYGDTALFYALSNNSLGVDFRVLLVKRLIDLGADINHHNRIEERPVLAEAVLTESDELIDVMLTHPRIDINAALEYLDTEGYCDGYAALLKRCACRYSDIFAAVKANDLFAVRGFIFAGADVDLRDHDGRTALMFAEGQGQVVVAEILRSVERGARR